MEESKQDIKLKLTSNVVTSHVKVESQDYDENGHALTDAHKIEVKTEDASFIDHKGLRDFNNIDDAKSSTGFVDSYLIKSEQSESVQSTITPQELWRKRRDANVRSDSELRDSPSRYASLYKARPQFSPSASRAKEIRTTSSDGRATYLMNARKIRMQTAENVQKSHFRSLSQCNARNRNDEFNGILRRPRRSLDSAPDTTLQFQANMCSVPHNIGFSFSIPQNFGFSFPSPYGSCSSLYMAPSSDGGDTSAEQNGCYFQVRPSTSISSEADTPVGFQENKCSVPHNRKFSFTIPQNIEFSFSNPCGSCSSLYVAPSIYGGNTSAEQNGSYLQLQPQFESYQLVGDSLLLRFAEQILNIPPGIVEGSRGLGLCVSGQKSGDLLRRVYHRMYPVSEKIVLLIGTNDVLQNIPSVDMCMTLKRLLELFKISASSIVLLTLPPIPKLQLREEHWEKIDCFNNYIRSLQDDVISVADIHNLYVTERRGCKMELFERYYGDGQRLDLIHLNRSGLEEIHKFLLDSNLVH